MEADSAQRIWETALGELQIQVNKPNYRTWLEKTTGLSYQDDQFVIGVHNTFVAEYLDKNQRSLIEKTLIGLTRQDITVVFQVNSYHQNSTGTNAPQAATPPEFKSKYTFDSFIVGSGNRLAYAAALGVVENPGRSYNPLFIYGGVGLGKTHLLHAIGHVALANHMNVLCVSAEQFTNQFINAIRERTTEEFRNKYRSVDMLLMDDIHFISGKEQTEESFFYTFNELHNANRQIAITSDRAPKSLPLLEDRLRSRFEWGLIADIQPPDFETRLAILRAKAEGPEISIPSDVLEFIAHQVQQNVRELEGSLNRVIAYARLTRAPVTPELAAQAIRDIATNAHKSAVINPELIIEAVVNAFQIAPQDLKSRRRDKETVLARQVAMYLLQKEANCSPGHIGEVLGGKSPSTVIHACKKIASNINASPFLQSKILDIQQNIRSNQKV